MYDKEIQVMVEATPKKSLLAKVIYLYISYCRKLMSQMKKLKILEDHLRQNLN